MLPEINRRIESFSLLGKEFTNIAIALRHQSPELIQGEASRQIYENAIESPDHNPWFTPLTVSMALESLGKMLGAHHLRKWCLSYEALWREPAHSPLTIAVIMAGNLPLVGFHDFLSVLISGNKILARLSSQDKHLPVAAANLLKEIEPGFDSAITFTEEIITGFDAVIATGSNNSSRYFEYYFGKYPSIIRRNRSGVAILSGDESGDELKALGKDVFSYYGLGCRNVSSIFVPQGYHLQNLTIAWQEFSIVSDNHKYYNNYDYQRAILMINNIRFTDTGFCILRNDPAIVSPISVIHLQSYSDIHEVNEKIKLHHDQIQCIVSSQHHDTQTAGSVPFGKSQQPDLWDYADGIDTLRFLSELR